MSAYEFAKINLVQMCTEMKLWGETGELKPGCVTQCASMLEEIGLTPEMSLKTAKAYMVDIAIDHAINTYSYIK